MKYVESDDRSLVLAFKDGDERAFEEIVRRYQRQVANVIYLTSGNRQDVEDLAQEVFIRVHKALGKVTVEHSLFSWIYRITVNVTIDEMRRRKIRKLSYLDFLAEPGDREPSFRDTVTPDDRIIHDEQRDQVRQALRKLSGTSRMVLLLREYEGLSYKEIGDVLHITEQAVKSRIFRAREELKELLKDYFKERL
ncbi:MAG: sigma-70 family RNA polymerase sigma factor [Ignavibacteriales bacterium]|nr:sigma-70 family RNA polymerase sigma factor [Ignavibacteriales bacterium]